MSGNRSDTGPLVLTAVCLVMNFALAIINNTVFGIQSSHVVALQLLAILTALAMLVMRQPELSADQACLIVALGACTAISAMYRGEIDARAIYDMAIPPLFFVLGTTISRVPPMYVHVSVAFVLTSAALETFFPDQYAAIVNPLSYYLQTREWVAAAVDPDAILLPGFYIGAQRYGEVEIVRRAGGIFLEPLSLGYFGCICAIYYLNEYRDSFGKKTLAIVACLALPYFADVRVAIAILMCLYIGAPALARLPKGIGLMLPVIVTGAAAAFYASGAISYSDPGDFSLRLSWTFDALKEADLSDLIFGKLDQTHANDSAVLYFGNLAGIPGYLILLYIASGAFTRHVPAFVTHATLIYLASTGLFGHAFASSKTAAFLGLIVGAVAARQALAGNTAAVLSPPTRHDDSTIHGWPQPAE